MERVVEATPRPLYPPGKTQYPLYKRLGGPQGRSGRVWKISPTPGFDPRTVQPVVNRCTDWAIPAHKQNSYNILTVKLYVSILYTDHCQVSYKNTTDRLSCIKCSLRNEMKQNEELCFDSPCVWPNWQGPHQDDSHHSNIPWRVQTRCPGILIEVSFIILPTYSKKIGERGGVVVKALHYKPAGRRFDSQ